MDTQEEKARVLRVPFSMHAWSYLRSTNSEMQSLFLVFNVLVATMVNFLQAIGSRSVREEEEEVEKSVQLKLNRRQVAH